MLRRENLFSQERWPVLVVFHHHGCLYDSVADGVKGSKGPVGVEGSMFFVRPWF